MTACSRERPPRSTRGGKQTPPPPGRSREQDDGVRPGVSNLTKDEAPVLIHIGKDKTQQWLLVRLKQSEPQTAGN